MAMDIEEVSYAAAGMAMHGRLFRAAGGKVPRPGVLVYPDGFGLGDYAYEAARRFAELGYVALACDLYGEAFRSHVGPTPEVEARAEKTSQPDTMRAIGLSAYELLAGRPEVDPRRIAAAGYCIGGTIGIDLAFSGAPVAAVAAFHPSFKRLPLGDIAGTGARLHLFVGAEDYAAPPEARAAFEAKMMGRGIRWRMTVYGGVKHSFTDPDCPGMGDKVEYDAAADRDSWNVTVAMFEEAFTEAGARVPA